MCVSVKAPSPPPAPEPVPVPTNTVSNATTQQVAPTSATGEASGRNTSVASRVARRRVGRGSLRIPLATSGLTRSGLNIPSA
tara:strand:+ start:395 stop:640 length:246 start_codon:yes stop_codon:yes gene_type:complete